VLLISFNKAKFMSIYIGLQTATTIQKGNNACEAANYQPITLNGNGWLWILVIIGQRNGLNNLNFTVNIIFIN
jgi:hypothetical protein